MKRFDEVKDRVGKIAFTDSVHSVTSQCSGQPDITLWISEVLKCYFVLEVAFLSLQHAINWVSCDQPLDTVMAHATNDAGKLSAGKQSFPPRVMLTCHSRH